MSNMFGREQTSEVEPGDDGDARDALAATIARIDATLADIDLPAIRERELERQREDERSGRVVRESPALRYVVTENPPIAKASGSFDVRALRREMKREAAKTKTELRAIINTELRAIINAVASCLAIRDREISELRSTVAALIAAQKGSGDES